VRGPVAFFAKGDYLAQSSERRAEEVDRTTFSANLAVSRALGRVVFICSCSKREVTRFLDTVE
jgi:hypothetical protein